MRETINEHTQIGTLIKEIKPTETSHTYHLSKDLKIVINAYRLCEICKRWMRNGDMEGEACWSCCENGRRISEEPDYKRVDY